MVLLKTAHNIIMFFVEKSVKEGARSGGNFSLHEHIMFKVSYLMASCPV